MIFRNYLNDNSKHFCTGCGACVQKCAKGALRLEQNELGYFVAHFEEALCVDCNLCEGVCPSLFDLHIDDRKEEPPLYAMQMNDDIRNLSSSGGVFTELANIILSNGGVVFGAAWMEDCSVKHICVSNELDLGKLRGSKYVQSYIGETFKECKRHLINGKSVLFSGTPCQIAGLYAYLSKDYDNLYTIDVLCFHTPSVKYLQSYLSESYPEKKIKSCNMRDKAQGWCCTNLVLCLSDIRGKDSVVIRREDDDWEKAFVSHLMMSEHCDNCKFATHKRCGDITLGDFWEICKIDKAFDNKGTNAVIVNSKKGEHLFMKIKEKSQKSAKKKLLDIKGNRIEKNGTRHNQSIRFEKLFVKNGFKKSVHTCTEDKHDVCVIGCWEIRNYGSHLTYFALYHFLKSIGKSVVFVGCPKDAGYKSNGLPEYFREIPYEKWEMHPQYENKIDMRNANKLSDTFIVGSDQLWYPDLYRYFGSFAYLDFIHSNKRKIAFATSFGKSKWEGSFWEKSQISYCLNRFSAVSVRETSGIDICKNNFDIEAQWNLDPVFLCEVSEYDNLASKSKYNIDEEYLLAYILDCDNEKAELMTKIGKEINVKVLIITDPNIPHDINNKYPVLKDIFVEDWIKLIRDSKYVITDSFHGMCVSIIYRKNFVALRNTNRGSARFDDYANALHINNRILKDNYNINMILDCLSSINYKEVNEVFEHEIPKSRKWLADAIKEPIKEDCLSDFDINGIMRDEEILLKRKQEEARNIKNRMKNSMFYKIIRKLKRTICG